MVEVLVIYLVYVYDFLFLMMLQGGIVYCDVLIESGLIKFLFYFQFYCSGYVVWWCEDFWVDFEEWYIQLLFEKGDVIFFNFVLFYVVGENCLVDIEWMVNFLQIFLVFGCVMEIVDCIVMCFVVFDVLKVVQMDEVFLDVVIVLIVEGYFFLINLDSDFLVGGFVFKIQQVLLKEVVFFGWDKVILVIEFMVMVQR